jgi:hypothetical protein
MLSTLFSSLNQGREFPIGRLVPNATHFSRLAVGVSMLPCRTRRVVTLPTPIPCVSRAALFSSVSRATLISLVAVVSGMPRAASISGLSSISGVPRITLLTGLAGLSSCPRGALCSGRGGHSTPGYR